MNGIKRGRLEAWFLDKQVCRMQLLLNNFEDFKIIHVLREANLEAGKLSNVGANGSLENLFSMFEDFRECSLLE